MGAWGRIPSIFSWLSGMEQAWTGGKSSKHNVTQKRTIMRQGPEIVLVPGRGLAEKPWFDKSLLTIGRVLHFITPGNAVGEEFPLSLNPIKITNLFPTLSGSAQFYYFVCWWHSSEKSALWEAVTTPSVAMKKTKQTKHWMQFTWLHINLVAILISMGDTIKWGEKHNPLWHGAGNSTRRMNNSLLLIFLW